MIKEKMLSKELIVVLDKDYSVDIKYKNESINLPENIRESIKENWNVNGERFTNGDIFFIKDYDVNKEKKSIKLDVCNSKYDHYLYTRFNDTYDEYSCVNLWSGAVIETSDGKLVLGEMSNETVSEGELHISGGSTDRDDLENNMIDYYKTMKRELYEELGIDLDNKNIVKDFYLRYLKIPSIIEVELSFGVLYKIDLNITFEEFKEKFYKYKKYLDDNKLEVEFTEVYGIDKNKKCIEEFEKNYSNRIPKYIVEMFFKEIECK